MSHQPRTQVLTETALHSREIFHSPTVRPPAILVELVERFCVCWESLPEVISVENEKRRVGFVLELHGTHALSGEHSTRNCNHCARVYGALRVIADWILPCEKGSSPCTIEIHAPFVSGAPLHGNRADIKLTVRVAHRRGHERPVNDCEIRCLKEVEGRLKELGASKTGTEASGAAVAPRRFT
jgi:hypothetical protein